MAFILGVIFFVVVVGVIDAGLPLAEAAHPGAAAMIAGHFGFAALVKARERQAPLWALMLATVWLDVVFVPLYLAGIERIEPAPGTHGGYGAGIIHADYTHSLVGALVLSGIFALFGVRWGRRSAWVLGFVCFSHWLLDLIVHRPDLPLLPGQGTSLPRLGFGLWEWPWAAASAELALLILGAWYYWQAAREVSLAAGVTTRRAAGASALILIGGILVLALDVSGFLG